MELKDKILSRGVTPLSDSELLAALLEDMPHPEECAAAILKHFNNSLSTVAKSDISRLRMIEGIGLKRAQRILVALELGRRAQSSSSQRLHTISSSEDVIVYFRPQLSSLPHEECWVVYLTSSNNVIETQRISSGGVGATIVDQRLIIKRALELLATQLIMVHNHPSGSAEPSTKDVELTAKIKEAAALFDIRLLDHIIISQNADCSMLSCGVM